MRDFFHKHRVELIVDAGYDCIHAAVPRRFAGRIPNVHPSLLEFACGMDAVERRWPAALVARGHRARRHRRPDAGPVPCRSRS